MKRLILLLLSFCLISNAQAKLNVLTSTPDLAWVVKEIGSDRVTVESLLDGTEDPHYVDAMPNWIAKLSKADVFCVVGLELEVGWAPKVLSRSGNAKIQPGGKGHCDAGKFVTAVEKPQGSVDRSMGDVHASGNPHYHLGPSFMLQAAEGITGILIENDPEGTQHYRKRLIDLTLKIKILKNRVQTIVGNNKNKRIMSYHREFSYFIKDFDLTYDGGIEETPGVPPSAGRIAKIGMQAKQNKVDLVLATQTNPDKVLNRFKEISDVPYVTVPISIKKNGSPSNYEELILGLANSLAEGKL